MTKRIFFALLQFTLRLSVIFCMLLWLPALSVAQDNPAVDLALETELEAEFETELVVAEVILNGQMYGTSIIVVDAEGGLYAREESLNAWSIQKPYPQGVQIRGQTFYPISMLPDYSSELDTTTYQLTIELSAAAFENQLFDLGSKQLDYTLNNSDSGVFIDYDINLQHDTLFGDNSGFLLKPVVFSPFGHFVSSMSWQSNPAINGREKLVFLENYFRHDNPEKQTTLRLGDSTIPSSNLGRALRFAGIQYGRNFDLQPRAITFPLPSIAGEATVPSTIDLFVNQSHITSSDTTPGLFEIQDIPIVNGAGELQLVVTDTLGRQTIINSNFYASTELLKKGLSAYSVNLGVLKHNEGIESFSYGDGVGVLDYQYGLNNQVTLRGRVESDSTRSNIAIGSTVNLWHKGILDTSFALSNQDGAGTGRIAYQYSSFRYRMSLGYQYTDRHYGTLGRGTIFQQLKQQFNLNTGMHINNWGSLGFSYIKQSFYQGDDFTVASLNFQTSIANLFNLSAYVSQVDSGGQNELSVGLSITRSFGADRSASMDYSGSSASRSVKARYNKFVPYGEGTGYNLAVSDNSATYAELEANWIKRDRQYSVELNTRYRESEVGVNANLSGSLSLINERIEFSREVQNAFALVKVADIPDVRVYLENQLVGKTDEDGYLLVPALRPYDANKLNISVLDLPIQTHIVEVSKVVSPYQSSGRLVSFDVSILKNYQFIAIQADSQIVEEGSLIYLSNPDIDEDAEEISITGYNGLVFLNLRDTRQKLYIRSSRDLCIIDVELLHEYKPLQASESLPQVVCQTVN